MMILLLNTNRSSNIFKYSVAFEYSVHNHGKSKIQIFVLEGGKSAGMHFLANQKQASLESP